ncbi:ankyrin repeat and SOCS box protein 6-like [Macrobrachium rosenbergii]|uniref:ankyrin repeat and SOCS box protein 6-like n=1 Tax=Macrobrachium rosenbergii TaxID=79674 RepID=UPI0034D78506
MFFPECRRRDASDFMKSLILETRRNKRQKLDGPPSCRALQQLKGIVPSDNDPSLPLPIMAPIAVGACAGGREGGGCARTALPFLSRLAPPSLCNTNNTTSHHKKLMTLADLLDGCPKVDPFAYQDTKVNSLANCRGSFTICNLLFGYEEQENPIDIEKFTPTALHIACLSPQPAPLVGKLVASGAPVNEANLLGQTPLHALLMGDIRSGSMTDALQILLSNGGDVSAKDLSGDTPLLSVRNLLKQGLFNKAAEVAQVLLQAGAQVDAVNNKGRTLLTYSIEHLDDSLMLTRTLLNNGASVWGAPDSCDKDQSVFTWFLKAVISRRKLENCSHTISILSMVMAENPRRMHQHVLRTMFRHSRCYKVLGPVFLELKTLMMPHWTQPPSLSSLCWRSVRNSLTPKKIHSSTHLLGLPPLLEAFILLEEPGYGHS